MKIFTTKSLTRGAALLDYAFSNKGLTLQVDAPDVIGLVAAYIGSGRLPIDLEADLSKRLNSRLAADAQRALDLFGHGQQALWSIGLAVDDVRFENKRLAQLYPAVNKANDQLLGR